MLVSHIESLYLTYLARQLHIVAGTNVGSADEKYGRNFGPDALLVFISRHDGI